mgnify:CR=1 FL=1
MDLLEKGEHLNKSTMLKFASRNMINKGTEVFFIVKLLSTILSYTKSIPQFLGNFLTLDNPIDLFVFVSAIQSLYFLPFIVIEVVL